MLGDAAFPLKPYMMRPYQDACCLWKDIFNSRLSRCRRLIENSFDILAATWRLLLRRIDLEPNKVSPIIMTCCLLHNMLRSNRQPPTGARLEEILSQVDTYDSFDSVAGTATRPTSSAVITRNKFKNFVNKNPIVY